MDEQQTSSPAPGRVFYSPKYRNYRIIVPGVGTIEFVGDSFSTSEVPEEHRATVEAFLEQHPDLYEDDGSVACPHRGCRWRGTERGLAIHLRQDHGGQTAPARPKLPPQGRFRGVREEAEAAPTGVVKATRAGRAAMA
jgi:hypothetical protein